MNILAKLYGKLTSHEINPLTEVLVTCGAYEALYSTICGHVEQCEEVIIIEPFFDCYEPMVRSTGGVPRFIALKPYGDSGDSGNWKLDEKELEGLFNEKTKIIIVNTPNNPLGKVYTRKELEKIAELCIKWDVLCISDEVYEWMIYCGKEHVRMNTIPGMWERTITIGSAGKTFSITGWKTGWAYGAEKLIHNICIVHQNCIHTHVTPIQEALARCFEYAFPLLDTPECKLTALAKQLELKRAFMCKRICDAGMKPVVPDGGYFMLTDWTPVEDKCDLTPYKDKYKDYRFTKWWAEHVGILGIPPTAFYSKEHKNLGEAYVRLCYIKVLVILDTR